MKIWRKFRILPEFLVKSLHATWLQTPHLHVYMTIVIILNDGESEGLLDITFKERIEYFFSNGQIMLPLGNY